MGRIRTIKPELFKHEKLYELEHDSKLPIRIAWIGLLTAVDRNGNFKWRPNALKTDILPYDDIDFSKVLDVLLEGQFLIKYGSPSESFGNIPTFLTHQRIQNTESQATIPSLADFGGELIDSNTSDPTNDPTPAPRLEKGLGKERNKERKGKEGKEESSETAAVVLKIPYEKIIDYLNQKTGKAFKYQSKETQKYIRGRFNDGATLDDFIKVIDIKTLIWKNDPKSKAWLRPSTLFRPANFENYLQEWEPNACTDSLKAFFEKPENQPDPENHGLLGCAGFTHSNSDQEGPCLES
ncbi:MAG: conserved phage C-terminal domain-containing protein [Thermodesulfobacteriota bacterium]